MSENYPKPVRPWEGGIFRRYAPSAYDPSMSVYEELTMIREYLNQLIFHFNDNLEWSNENFKRIYKQIDEMIKEIERFEGDVTNVLLPENLVKILNEWFDNGKLAEIINEQVFNMKADKKDLDALELLVKNNLYSRLKLMKRNKKGFYAIHNVGDSISHGSASDFADKNSFAGIVRKAIQMDFHTKNFGYVNWYQPSPTVDIMRSFSTAGGWKFLNTQTGVSDDALGFLSMQASTVDAETTGFFRLANTFKFKFMGLQVAKTPEGGNLEVRVNGEIVTTIDCSSPTKTSELVYISTSKFDFLNSVQFFNRSGTNELLNLYWIDSVDDVVFNNYANSGERLTGLTDSRIDQIFDCSALIFSLGHNTVSDAEMDIIFDKCKLAHEKYKPLMFVNDFSWDKTRVNVSAKLKKFAEDTGATYFRVLPMVDDSQTLINQGFLKDRSHPTNLGHELIANKHMAELKTGFQTKSSIEYTETARLEADKMNNLYEDGIIIYKGKLDKNNTNYPLYAGMKIAMELKVTSGSLPNGLYIGKNATLPGLFLYSDDAQATISNALPTTKGEYAISAPSWSAVKYDAKISIGNTLVFDTIPVDKKCKFTGAIVTDFTTTKTSLKDIILYN